MDENIKKRAKYNLFLIVFILIAGYSFRSIVKKADRYLDATIGNGEKTGTQETANQNNTEQIPLTDINWKTYRGDTFLMLYPEFLTSKTTSTSETNSEEKTIEKVQFTNTDAESGDEISYEVVVYRNIYKDDDDIYNNYKLYSEENLNTKPGDFENADKTNSASKDSLQFNEKISIKGRPAYHFIYRESKEDKVNIEKNVVVIPTDKLIFEINFTKGDSYEEIHKKMTGSVEILGV